MHGPDISALLAAPAKLILSLLFFLALLCPAWAEQPVPPLSGRVVDSIGLLPGATRKAIETSLAVLEADTGAQLAVLILPSTSPETIEQYAIRVAERWKLGRKGIDDGVILLVAKEDRQVRIEVGYGLEGAIPDARAKQIIAQQIIPKFKQGDFAAGIEAGVQSIDALVRGEELPEPVRQNYESNEGLLFTIVILGVFLARIFNGVFPSTAGSSLIAALGSGVFAWFLISAAAAIVVALLVLLFSLGSWLDSGGHGGVYRSGRSSGRGGFGGGGFSGGGGSFGGGGASGSW
jgi:uncharacterized protein